MKVVKGFKFVTAALKSGNGNVSWKLGEWQKHVGELKLCSSGFHACRDAFDAFSYVQGDKLFLVEAKGRIVEGKDKFAAEEMRLTLELPAKEIAVEFAIKCARHVLKHYENKYPADKRVRNALLAAEKWLKEPNEENRKAAAKAAGAAGAAEGAAWAAGAAAGAAGAAEGAAGAAGAAVAAVAAEGAAWAAWAAAWAAAGAAGAVAEGNWQRQAMKKIIAKRILLGKQ